MMDGPACPVDFLNLDEPDQTEEAGSDKAGPATQYLNQMSYGLEPDHAFQHAQEKELNRFIQSVLNKTSKLHVLVGELQTKYDDPRAAKFLGQRDAGVMSCSHIYITSCGFPAGPKM